MDSLARRIPANIKAPPGAKWSLAAAASFKSGSGRIFITIAIIGRMGGNIGVGEAIRVNHRQFPTSPMALKFSRIVSIDVRAISTATTGQPNLRSIASDTIPEPAPTSHATRGVKAAGSMLASISSTPRVLGWVPSPKPAAPAERIYSSIALPFT